MTEQTTLTPIEAINEFYRLKDKYETEQLKIGLYANACNKSLIVMVEVMDKVK
jgi:hypothetical protein